MNKRLIHFIVCVVIVLVAGAVFARSLTFDFLWWDDDVNIVNNPNIRQLNWTSLRWMFTQYDNTLNRYTPLVWLGLGIDYALFGLKPYGYHLGNVLLHLANSLLIFSVIRRILERVFPDESHEAENLEIASALAALFWSIHPLGAEPVCWVMGRNHLQSTFFILLALLTYLKSLDAPRTKSFLLYGLSILFFAASVFTYPIGVSFPVILIVLDFYPLRRLPPRVDAWMGRRGMRLILGKIPYLLIAALAAAIALAARFNMEGFAKPVPLSEFGLAQRLAQACYIWAYYFVVPLMPVNLSPVYTRLTEVNPAHPIFMMSMVFVVVMTNAAFLLRRCFPGLATLWLCYLIMMVPYLGLTEHPHYPSDRYFYLSGICWAVLVAATFLKLGVSSQRKHAWALYAAACVVVAIVAVATYRQTLMWKENRVFFSTVITRMEDHPFKGGIHFRFGVYEMSLGNRSAAREHYEAAIRLAPLHADALNNLGLIQLEDGQVDQSLELFKRAFAANPAHFFAMNNAGVVLMRLERQAEAEEILARAVAVRPDYYDAIYNLGVAQIHQGKLDEAIHAFRQLFTLRPDTIPVCARVVTDAGAARLNEGKPAEAIRFLETALTLLPQYPLAMKLLGRAELQAGRRDEARVHLTEALKLIPDDPDILADLKELGAP